MDQFKFHKIIQKISGFKKTCSCCPDISGNVYIAVYHTVITDATTRWSQRISRSTETKKIKKNLTKTEKQTHSEDDESPTFHGYGRDDDAYEDDDCWVHCQSQPRGRSTWQGRSPIPVTGSRDSQQGAASPGPRRKMIGWGWRRPCCQSQWSVAVDSLSPCVNNMPQGLTTHGRHQWEKRSAGSVSNEDTSMTCSNTFSFVTCSYFVSELKISKFKKSFYLVFTFWIINRKGRESALPVALRLNANVSMRTCSHIQCSHADYRSYDAIKRVDNCLLSKRKVELRLMWISVILQVGFVIVFRPIFDLTLVEKSEDHQSCCNSSWQDGLLRHFSVDQGGRTKQNLIWSVNCCVCSSLLLPGRAQLMARSQIAASLGWMSVKCLLPIPINTLSCRRSSGTNSQFTICFMSGKLCKPYPRYVLNKK